jgi:hypothetical protein
MRSGGSGDPAAVSNIWPPLLRRRMPLQTGTSVMSPDQPMVPAGYGDTNWTTSQGGGGMSAAMTDLARLVAVFLDQKDTPALKRATLTSMLNRAAALQAAGNGRAGYGLDAVATQTGGLYYGQKGGEIINAAGVLQFNGEWGFVLCFGSPAQVPNQQPVWYPDFTPMMNIATTTSWSPNDLFPDFGMPSL